MVGESSPDPLQEPSSGHPLKSATRDDSPISSVGPQRDMLSQLESSQYTTTSVFLDDKNNRYRIVQSDKRGPNSMYHPPEEKQVIETNELFSFAPQPKHRPNQFSGRQKQLNIDFQTLETPTGEPERPVVDTPPLGSVTPRQCWEWTSPKDCRNHQRKVLGSQSGNSSSDNCQEKATQSATDDRDPNSVQPELEHVSNRAVMLTQYATGGTNPPFEHHSATKEVSVSQRNVIDHHLGFAMEGRLNGRPFADADASFPGIHQIPAQASNQSPVIDNSTISCLNSPRGENDGIFERAHASVQRIETMVPVKTPQSSNGNKLEKVNHGKQCHTPRHNKQDIKEKLFRSRTPVGDLELPQKGTPSTASKQRRRRAPRQQPIRPFKHEEERESVPRRTLSRQSNVSRHRQPRHHQERRSQLTQEEVDFNNQVDHRYGQPHKQNIVQKSHFDVLKSMMTHHNMFLEDARLTEENLKNKIVGQEREIEALETRLERSHLLHQQEQGKRKTLRTEISSLQQKKNEATAIMAQRDGREQELEAEVARLQALKEQHAVDTSKLKNKLEETQSKLDKLQEKGRGYRDHLNKAIAEHQELWQQSKDISQKAIDDMRKEHQESEEYFRLTLEEKQAAQDTLNRIFNDKKAVLQHELNAAALNTKSLESAMEKLEGDLLAEADKTKGLEEQLGKSRDQETLLLRVEENIGQISDKLDEVRVKSVQANVVPTSVTERLDEITAYVHSAPQVDLVDEIRQALNIFQGDIMSQFLQELKSMATGNSTIENRLQSLEKTIQNQAVLAQTERQNQQEQLLQQIFQEKEENQGLFQTLQSKDNQMTEISNAISELARKPQELKASVVLASQNGTNSETEIRVLQELLLSRDHQVSETQAELRLQREGHEMTLRELRERLLRAEEDVLQKSELVKDSQCETVTAENGFAAKAKEQTRELELQLRHSEDSRQNIQQQLSGSEAEIKRLKALGDSSEAFILRNELNDANQRIANLTFKLREAHTLAVDAGVLDQLAEQLAQLNNMKNEIKQLKASGDTYTTISKELATMLSEQDAARGDEILAPDSLVVPEPDLPGLRQGDSVNSLAVFEFTSSSETALVQSGKKTVFRRPVEEPYQEVSVPSVAQEKLQRREARSQGSHPRPILRQQRMATGSSNAPKEPLVTRHAGHSSYNRPVQGASMTGQIAISDVRYNLLGNRKAQVSDLTSHGDWQKMAARESQGVQQGTKRSSSAPPSSQRSKRSKTGFPADDDGSDNGPSVAGEGSIGSSPQVEPSQQTGRDITQTSQGQSQDEDYTSRHFDQISRNPDAESICQGNVGKDRDSQQKQPPSKIGSSNRVSKKSASEARFRHEQGMRIL